MSIFKPHDCGTPENGWLYDYDSRIIYNETTLTSRIGDILRKNGLAVEDGVHILELQIPPQEFANPGQIVAAFRNCLTDIARTLEIVNNDRAPDEEIQLLVGLGYLADHARRFGFTVLDVDEEIKRTCGACRSLADKTFRLLPKDSLFSRRRREMQERFTINDIRLCYIETGDLIFRYNETQFPNP